MASRKLHVIDTHAEGMPMRVLMEGAPPIPGDTMVDRLEWARENLDDIRQLVVNEPRGHAAMVAAILTPPARADADYGVIYMSGGGFWAMCGHGTIAVISLLVEREMVKVTEPYTEVRLDTPAGLIVGKVRVDGKKALNVTFTNVPSFAIKQNAQIEVPGVGQLTVDVSYGGNMFAIVDTAQLGRKLDLADLEELTNLGLAIVRATREQVPLSSPWSPSLGQVKSMLFIEEETADRPAKNLMVKERRYFDRSPCGTGTSARMALAYARGQLALDQPLVCQSLLGGKFEGRLTGTTEVDGVAAVIPTITGRAWITGSAEFIVDPSDVFQTGFEF